MLPLVGLAATFVPELIRLIAGDKAGTVADNVSKAVVDVAKTSDPVQALQALQADAAAATELRTRLAQIAVDAQKVQNDEADKKRQDELSALKANIENTQGARSSLLELAKEGSKFAWGAPIVSIVVTVGFIVILALVIIFGNRIGNFGGLQVAPGTASNSGAGPNSGMALQIVNICVGTLATGFATVVNFWLGSSQGSRDKDISSLNMQAAHAEQLDNAINAVKSVTNNVVDTAMRPPAPAAAPIPAQQNNFDRCVATTLSFEGGFTDKPDDPGGATNFGITKRTLEAFLGRPVTVDEVKNLSSNTAIEIYRSNYWNLMRCGSLPAGVDLMVFDYGVNSGPGRAVMALQGLAGVKKDGAMGDITLPAVAKVPARNLIDDLATERWAFLQTLANFAENENGWRKRVTDVHQKALEMARVFGSSESKTVAA